MHNSRTLRFKINVSIVVTFVVIAVIFSTLLTIFEVNRRSNAIKQDAGMLSELMQHNRDQLGNEIFAGHERAAQMTLQEIAGRENILAASAYDDTGAFFISTEETQQPDLPEGALQQLETKAVREESSRNGHSVLVYTSAVKVYGEIVGYARFYYSLSSLDSETWHIVAIFSGLLLTFLILTAALLNIMMTRMVLKPLYSLKNAMLQVISAGKGKAGAADMPGDAADDAGTAKIPEMILAFDHIYAKFPVHADSADEIATLALSFRHMVAALRTSYLDLKQAEEKYHGIFENALEGLFQLDLQGRIISANQSMARLWGYASEQELAAAVGNFGQQCFARPEDLARVLQTVQEYGRVSGVEIEFKVKDGEHFWGAMALHFVSGSTGELLYYEGSIVDITERLEKERAQSEREIAEAAARARREIMDNSGQGFLSFGVDLLVEEEYSLECEKIFASRKIAGSSVDSLLFVMPCQEQKDFARNMVRILNERNQKRKRLFVSLMPKEFLLNDRHIKVVYRLLSSRRMMLILSDVTKQRNLENAVELERSRLAFIVASIKNREQFFEALEDLKKLLQHIESQSGESQEDPAKELHEWLREIHTAKGNFALLDFVHLPRKLHEVETHLSHMLESGTVSEELDAMPLDAQLLRQAAEADCEMIREALGTEYFDARGDLTIPAEKVQALLRLGERILSRYGDSIDLRTAELVRELQQIRYVEFSSLLEMYPRLVQQLAERLDKEVRLFHIESPGVRVDPDRFGPFARSLVHIFRNAVDHGIESPDERLEAGKDVWGRVACRLNVHDKSVEMVISDDGRGIDLDVLRKRADELQNVTMPDDPLELIFMDGLSSKKEATELSGRGVGLAAVRASVDALGGTIKVDSQTGKGTSFHITLPLG